jgi:hypothetical protein
MSAPNSGDGADRGLARRHPVDVAAHGVDLAVVGRRCGRGAPGARTGKVLVENRWWTSASAEVEIADRAGPCSRRRAGRRGTCPCRPACGSAHRHDVEIVRLAASSKAGVDPVGRHHLADDVQLALELGLSCRRHPCPRPMKTWRWNGSVATISGALDSERCRTGTSRQPSTGLALVLDHLVRPRAPSSQATHGRRRCGMKIWADGILARFGRQRDALLRRHFLAKKKACGICTSMPAPSPISGSAPTAPRCSRFSRMARPSLRRSRLRLGS